MSQTRSGHYGHVRGERRHPSDQGADLPLDRLLGGAAQVPWECFQSLHVGHVVWEQLSHFDELQHLYAPDQLSWDRGEAAGEAKW
jgi:hypothetical protein